MRGDSQRSPGAAHTWEHAPTTIEGSGFSNIQHYAVPSDFTWLFNRSGRQADAMDPVIVTSRVVEPVFVIHFHYERIHAPHAVAG